MVAVRAGSHPLQRRAADGDWETLDTRPTSRTGQTPVELPQDADAPPTPTTFRVVFSPKNTDITSWISEPIDG